MKKCKICPKKHYGKGLCKMHWHREWYKTLSSEEKSLLIDNVRRYQHKTINHPDYVFQRIAMRIERAQLREILGWLK